MVFFYDIRLNPIIYQFVLIYEPKILLLITDCKNGQSYILILWIYKIYFFFEFFLRVRDKFLKNLVR